MAELVRFCPKCQTERSPEELFCEGESEGVPCNWALSDEPFRPEGWRPAEAAPPGPTSPGLLCSNGHSVNPGDLLCEVCGADLEIVEPTSLVPEVTTIDGWRLERPLQTSSEVRERYVVVSEDQGRSAVLTLYRPGNEPDPDVYSAIRILPREYVPELIATGRWNDRAYEVTEELRGGTLDQLHLSGDDLEAVSVVVREMGDALRALGEAGLRHRDLRPGAILVRETAPLDLVITSFGSARLSEFDLDVVSPLETTRYTAPEAIAGGVAAASDWWSLGIVLLEQITRGACFIGVNDQAFLIHVVTNGAPIPDGLNPRLELLLKGLLTVDRRKRWCWPQVHEWLEGGTPEVAAPHQADDSSKVRSIRLGGKQFTRARAFALAAADASNWNEARQLLLMGALAGWAEDSALSDEIQSELRRLSRDEDTSEDIRLALALKSLNSDLPLVCKGEIISPAWLLDHPNDGYALITGPVPDLLAKKDAEPWLSRLKRRAQTVRERAEQLSVVLNEDEFRVHALSTSRSRMAAIWAERRQLLPDTDHPGLIAILERRQTADEDYILLLSADVGQFRTSEVIVAEAAEAAVRAGVDSYDPAAALQWLQQPRREIHAEIEQRLLGFARCGNERVDEWADQFRLEHRLPLSRALTLLAVPTDRWQTPPRQAYVAALLEFFGKRVTGTIMRGPLTRLIIGKTTSRLDLKEFESTRRSAASLLDHLLLRNGQIIDLDPVVLASDPRVESRLRTLHSHANLYRRDTGIDGLYMGFPFLLMQESGTTRKPRIAPVFLWPIKLNPEVGARGRVSIAFDSGREEVRVNPAFDTILGLDATRRWQEAANELLGRASLSAADVMDGLGELARVQNRSLVAVPPGDVVVRAGEDQLICAAALFHLAYIGHAIMEDLRQLKAIPPTGSSLETALRVGDDVARPDPVRGNEVDRFFTAASDPSQERAVFEARAGRGLLVEGPPGTGKSQTIVNMVSDAIGRGQSLLIVCQKQAALEVVHKRLEAEGLGSRIVMVNDVNKDRRSIIQAVREQIESIWSRRYGDTNPRQLRSQFATRIDALEGELDRHHRALHEFDESSGSNYRLILSDLIGWGSRNSPPIDVPALRGQLGGLDVAEVAALQEACGPLARLWLPSKYEDSPLSVLALFSADAPTAAAVKHAFGMYRQVENDRAEVIERTPRAFPIEDPAPYRAWAAEHATALLHLDDGARERLARWLPLVWPETGMPTGEAIVVDLAEIMAAVAELPNPVDQRAGSVAARFDDEALAGWISIVDSLAAPPGVLAQLSPARWYRQWRLRKLLTSEQLADEAGLRDALHVERSLRPWRIRAVAARAQLKEQESSLEDARPAELLALLGELRTRVERAFLDAARFTAHPAPEAARATARTATRAALEDLIDHAEQGTARYEARRKSMEGLSALRSYFRSEWLEKREQDIARDLDSAAALNSIEPVLDTLVEYQRFRSRAQHLDERALSIFRSLRSHESELASLPLLSLDEEVRSIIGRESRLAWKARLEGTYPELLLEASELDAKKEMLGNADHEMRKLNRKLLAEGVDATRLKPAREWETITRLQGRRARRLREFVDGGAELGLMALRPVWLMNPDVASRVLPLRKALFDTVIYDEASQMPIEYALPTLYRSRTMIVSGDEKQMPPTAFFASKVENDEAGIFDGEELSEEASEGDREEYEETWNRREIKDCPDLLQLAKTVLPPTTLQIHYRSVYRELINFSNAAFYSNALSVPARHPVSEVLKVRPIELVRVDGIYEDQTNFAEAVKVVDVVAELWRREGKRKTVGVVTFNRKQADLIELTLEKRAEGDSAFRAALTEERDRIEDGEDMGFFVKNVENVQGDERDVIVFSSTFGRNKQGAFRRSFGVLGQTGGERRLNVAVTRAREKVMLVTSMPISQISDLLSTRRQASTPRDFLQAYFEYARTISEGDLGAADSLLKRLVSSNTTAAYRNDGDDADGFVDAVEREMKRLGWQPVRVSDEGAFGLDFAVEDPRTGLYAVGIECDSPRHALLEFARAREMWRPSVLRRSIPVVHRVSSTGWYHSPDREKELLAEAVTTAMQGRAA